MKSIIVIYHIEDQSVWIDSIKILPNTHDGLLEAIEYKNSDVWDYIQDFSLILDYDFAISEYTSLINMNSNQIYDYMRKNYNISTNLDDIVYEQQKQTIQKFESVLLDLLQLRELAEKNEYNNANCVDLNSAIEKTKQNIELVKKSFYRNPH